MFREIRALDCLILGDRILWFERRPSAWLSKSGDCFGYEDILLEEALADELFQVPSEAPKLDGLVPFIVVVGVVLFCSEM